MRAVAHDSGADFMAPVPVAPATTLDLTRAPEGAAAEDLLERFLRPLRPDTVRAYRGDLEAFRSWFSVRAGGEHSLDDALGALFTGHPTSVFLLGEDYRESMREAGLAPSTVNRRLSTLRAMFKLARRMGRTRNSFDVDGVRQETRRPTKGPTAAEAARMLAIARTKRDPARAARDYCVLRLLIDLGLRRREVCTLDLAHVDLDGDRPTVSVHGKCRSEREALSLPPQTVEALRAWIGRRPAVVGTEPTAPLFCALEASHVGKRLSPNAVYDLCTAIGKAAGVSASRARPHGLRHVAATVAAKVTNGDVFRLIQFTRHKGIAVAQRYVDAEKDEQGVIAAAVAAQVDAAG